MRWIDRIHEWRLAAKPATLSLDTSYRIADDLKDMLPGQFAWFRHRASGREYAVLELEELRALLDRAGIKTRTL